MLFSRERRPILKNESFLLDALKIIGNQWQEMTELEKSPYTQQAEAGKRQYEAELAAYLAKK